MADFRLVQGALALYKIRPALVVEIGEKIEIELEGGKRKRVRPKDIEVLHAGPLTNLDRLQPCEGDFLDAWELLNGESAPLDEFAALVFGDYTPETAWAAWLLLSEGLHFAGSINAITARSRAEVEADLAAAREKEEQEAAWAGFMERLKQRRLQEEDRQQLAEVERVALGQSAYSKILKELGYAESPESAHRMLIKVGYWPEHFNPHPGRQGVALQNPDWPLPPMTSQQRLDMTSLPAYAIDDEGSQDPDDAISIDGDRIWVHVADAAALVSVDSDIDTEARQRGGNLYLPERIVHMLPPQLTHQLALGLREENEALSVGFRLDEQGQPCDVQVALTRVRVTRMSYAEADKLMQQSPFSEISKLTQQFNEARQAAGCANIDLPEVSVRLDHDKVTIKPLSRDGSRTMVAEAMMMAGRAVALFAQQHEIPLPYASQPAPENPANPQGLAAMYAYRRQMKPSRQKTEPEWHAGLGLPAYVRATSPLRRYLDLVVHQQLRRFLLSEPLLSKEEISTRIIASDLPSAAIRRAERFSNQHWKLVYLQSVGEQDFTAVPVELDERKATVIIPDLALEVRMRVHPNMQLDQLLQVNVAQVELEELEARFRVS